MRAVWQILKRIFFWSYERGTWQYDLAVVAIVVFVLFTPRNWFHDEPQVGLPESSSAVTLVGSAGEMRTYRVDARVFSGNRFGIPGGRQEEAEALVLVPFALLEHLAGDAELIVRRDLARILQRTAGEHPQQERRHQRHE